MSLLEHNYNLALQRSPDICEHIPTLKKYASECDNITEMGVRAVNSTWGLLAGKPKRMISYDLYFAGPPMFPDADIASVFATAREEDIVYGFIQESSLKAAIRSTDLLFLDTWHVYEQLSKELLYHSDKVKKYIILHDTEAFKTSGEFYQDWIDNAPFKVSLDKGLWQAVEEFLDRNKHTWVLHEHHTNQNGLTILKRKNGTYEL